MLYLGQTPDIFKDLCHLEKKGRVAHFLAARVLVSILKVMGQETGQAPVLLEVQYMSCKGVRHGRIKLVYNRGSKIPTTPFSV